MATIETALIGGMAMGLASAIHCGAMCSGVCSGALLFLQPSSARQRIVSLLLLQGGRITTYALFGGAGAFLGSTLITPDIAFRFRTLQWAGAVAMMAMGLSMAGLLPRSALLDKGAVHLSQSIERILTPLRKRPTFAPYAMGLIWGANACPMVYGAVFTAALAGSVAGGASFMTGFGLGTLPALLAAGFGVSFIKSLGAGTRGQTAAGVAIAIAGFSTLYVPWPAVMALCFTR
jgi:uncharacterized protein